MQQRIFGLKLSEWAGLLVILVLFAVGVVKYGSATLGLEESKSSKTTAPTWSKNFTPQDKRVANALYRDCLRGKPMPGIIAYGGKTDKRLCGDTVSLLIVARSSLCTETQVLSYDGGTTPEVGCVTTPAEWLNIANCRRLIYDRVIKYHPPIERECLDRKREVLRLRAQCQRHKKILIYSSNVHGMVCARKASIY